MTLLVYDGKYAGSIEMIRFYKLYKSNGLYVVTSFKIFK
jgi:hypothetical protein